MSSSSKTPLGIRIFVCLLVVLFALALFVALERASYYRSASVEEPAAPADDPLHSTDTVSAEITKYQRCLSVDEAIKAADFYYRRGYSVHIGRPRGDGTILLIAERDL